MKFLSKKRIVALLLILSMLLAVPVPLASAEQQPVGGTTATHAGEEGWITDGVYYIRSAAEPDFVWSLHPDQVANEHDQRQIVLDEYSHGNTAQMFVIQRDRSSESLYWEYRIRSVDTSVDNAWVDVPGGAVDQPLALYANGAIANSQLYIDYESDGTFTFRSDTAGKNYVGKKAQEGDSYSYLAVNTNGRDNTDNHWILEPATIPLESQYYTIRTAVDENYVLDVWDRSTDSGAPLGLYTGSGAVWQHFYFRPTSDGYFTITSEHSNLFVSAPEGYVDATEYKNVVQLGTSADGSVLYESKWSVIPNFDGTHSIVNAYNGLYLDLSGATASDNNMVGLYSPNWTIAQKWKLETNGTHAGADGWITDGVYYIRSAAEPDFVWSLNPDQPGVLNQRKIVLDKYSSGTTAQMFVIQRDTSGHDDSSGEYYRIRSVETTAENAWVDVPGGAVDQPLETYTDGYIPNSQMRIDYRGDGTFTFSSRPTGGYVGKSAGDPYSYLAVNTNGEDHTYNRWILEPATIPLDSVHYTIRTAVDNNFVLDVWGESTASGAQVGLWAFNSANVAWQQFYFQPTPDGYFTITSAHSNRFVSAPKGYAVYDDADYKNIVQLGTYTEGSVPYESKWSVIPNIGGTHSIVNAYNGLYLDLKGGNASEGIVGLCNPNGDDPQKWKLETNGTHAGMEGWITDGVYYIRSAAEPDFVWSLDPDQPGVLNQRKIVLDEYSFGTTAQMFVIQRDTSGYDDSSGEYYRIRSVETTAVDAWVDVPGGAAGETLETFTGGHIPNSQMRIDYRGDGTFTFSSRPTGGYVGKSAQGDSYSYLEVNTYDENPMYTCWILEPATIPLDSVYYTIQAAKDENYVLDLWNFSTAYGAELGLYTSNNEPCQHFYFQPTSDGYFTIPSAHSNRFVSAPVGYVDDTTYSNVVQLGTYADGSVPYESKWSVIPNIGGDTYSLVNAYNGLYLDLWCAKTENDIDVGLCSPNGDIAQKWKLKADVVEYSEFFNQDPGIYADSFDTSDTVSLPIKIFDYDNDGMLFEWSSALISGDEKHECYNEANGTYWAMGNNNGFGLVNESSFMREGYGNHYYSYPVGSEAQDATIYRNINDWLTDSRELTGLGYKLYQEMSPSDQTTIGLLQGTYNAATRTPLYKQEAVTYVADLLDKSLRISRGGDGSGRWVNHYNYVMGEPNAERYGRDENGNALDFAEWIRRKTNYDKGSYEDTAKKNLIGSWEQCSGNIETLYDAAYFMLNNLFIADSYNEPQSTYDYLVLTKATSSELGRDGYVFDCGFTNCATPKLGTSSVVYDAASKTIRNTSAAGKASVLFGVINNVRTVNGYNAIHPMLPITDKNNEAQDTESPYWMDTGVSWDGLGGTDTYTNRNFNFAIQSNGSFVYREDDELFFDFAGDDDVYLFINGELVMDIGGGHTIATALIELNDYVQAARAEVAELGENASSRAKALALVEGNSYSFDFYYLERHGTAANMRIFTNFRVTDTSVEPLKKAYQDDIEVNYGGIVDAEKPVEYAFALKNTGNAARYCLSFHDAAIGVSVSYNNGLVVTGDRVCDKNGNTLDATDLVAVFTDANGNVTTTTFASDDELKTYLCTPAPSLRLGVGETVELRGIYYRLSEEQIQKGGFKNVVSITSMPNSDGSGTPIEVSATMQIFVPCEPRYYQWAGNELNVSIEKLISDLNEANANVNNPLYGKIYGTLTKDNLLSIKTCLSSGMEYTDKNFTVDASKNLHINYPDAGSYSPYLKVTYSNQYGTTSLLVNVLVNVFDVEDSCYVLDYGLAVDLTKDQPLYANDTLSIAGVATNTRWEGLASYEPTPSYGENHITYTPAEGNKVVAQDGTFEMSNDTSRVTFRPTSFMDEASYCYLAVRVSDDSITAGTQIGTVDINNEVEMYQKITIVPASVVYYEDDFPAIDYTSPDENVIDDTGSSAGEFQSADQNTPYGYDDAYAQDTDQTMSAGTLYTIQIPEGYTIESAPVATFTFAGTGFELVSRTNAYDSASLVLKVKDENENTIKLIPVVTEFNNNADGENASDTEVVYQVPVIRVEDLTFGTYTVEIYGVPMYDHTQSPKVYIPTYLYLDGIRIFDPVGGTDIPEEYYSDTEVHAEILEVRELALEGKATFVTRNEDGITLGTALSTFTENRNNHIDGIEYEGNTVDSIDNYLMVGPNNEVYLNGKDTKQALVLYVNEDELLETVSALQVAVRLIDDKGFYGETGSATHGKLYLGIAAEDGFAWRKIDDDITSGTEQYYNVSFKDCPYIDGKGYQVVLCVTAGILSFTSIKNSGLFISENTGEACDLYYQGGFLVTPDDRGEAVVVNAEDYPDFRSLREMMFTPIEEADPELPPEEVPTEPEVPEEPIVDESLKFKSASLTLESDIAMNFYARDTVLEGWENPYVVFTKAIYSSNGIITGYETEKVSSFVRKADYSGVPCHCFRFDGVKAYEMGSQVTATLYAYKDGVLYKGAVVDYSVFKYASNMLNKTSDDALKTLLVDALNYGAAAQTYFEYNQENLVNEDLTEELAALATAQNPAVTSRTEVIKNEEATVSFKAVSLVLKDKVTFNYYLNLANYNGDIEDLELRISYTNAYGEEDTAVIDGSDFAYKRYTDGNYYYVANFSELYAFQMREICSAEVYSKTTDTVISSTVLYSIESYVASKTNSDQNALVQLLWDMMKYGDAAENYFKKN